MAETPVVIVTRPEREAESWATALLACGVRTDILPLIQIAPLPDASALRAAWANVPRHLAVMFVSANAVRFFMAERPAGWACKLAVPGLPGLAPMPPCWPAVGQPIKSIRPMPMQVSLIRRPCGRWLQGACNQQSGLRC